MALLEARGITKIFGKLTALNGAELDGRTMNVNEARPKLHRDPARDLGSRDHRRRFDFRHDSVARSTNHAGAIQCHGTNGRSSGRWPDVTHDRRWLTSTVMVGLDDTIWVDCTYGPIR